MKEYNEAARSHSEKTIYMPVVRPLNINEIANPMIRKMLVREKHTCESYSIVASPKALKGYARHNMDR